MPGTFSPAADFKGNRWLAIPTCITARAWRTCRDACRDRLPAVTGKTFPAFPAHAHPQICVSGKRPIDCRQYLLPNDVLSLDLHVPTGHDDVIKWKHFPRNWPFVREIHRSPVNCPHKGQWRGALMFSLIYAWINDWVNNREAGDLRRQHGHYDVIVMPSNSLTPVNDFNTQSKSHQ